MLLKAKQSVIVGNRFKLQVMEDTDIDHSGALDYEEFLAATVNMSLLEREEVLMKTFHDLDKVTKCMMMPQFRCWHT